VFLERAYERSSGFSINDWSSLLLNDGLTYGVSYKRSTMGAYVEGDTHEKSGMARSTWMPRKNGGTNIHG